MRRLSIRPPCKEGTLHVERVSAACRHGYGHLRHYINMRSRLKCPGAERYVPPRLSACPVFPLLVEKRKKKKKRSRVRSWHGPRSGDTRERGMASWIAPLNENLDWLNYAEGNMNLVEYPPEENEEYDYIIFGREFRSERRWINWNDLTCRAIISI